MPDSRQAKSLPPNIVAQIALGEAASEGPEGLAVVLDTMFNRGITSGKTLEQIATAPWQFSAYSRPDLAEFYEKQPLALRRLTDELIQERRNPNFTPKYRTKHYVTEQRWKTRDDLPDNHWLHKMFPVMTVGHHVLLDEIPKPPRR